jgi:hypothetical protein
MIFQLEQDEGKIIGQENLKNYISEYYKNLLCPPPDNYCVLNESVTHDIKQLSETENNILIADFTEKEVHEAIIQMEKNKSPRQDEFPAEFYQKKFGTSLS